MNKTKVIFLGTAKFSAEILQSLLRNQTVDVIAVVSQPDRIVGRKKEVYIPEVKMLALKNNIPVYQPEKLSGSTEMDELIELNADFLITAAFGQFLPVRFLESAKIAAINVHASLLPKYRGAAPINWAIINGDEKTGVSIMYMVKEMDAGNVIDTVEVEIDNQDNAGNLFDKLAEVGSVLLNQSIKKIVSGEAHSMPQDESEVTFAPKIDSDLLKIDFKKQTAKQVIDLARGLTPADAPYFSINNTKINIHKASVKNIENAEPGIIVQNDKNGLVVSASDSKGVFIEELQIPGKKKMTYKDFFNGIGRKIKLGSVVE